jgi:hypothetical protein
MVTVEILGSVLQFAIFSLVQIFHDGGSGRFGSLKMCLDVFDENWQALRPKTKLY